MSAPETSLPVDAQTPRAGTTTRRKKRRSKDIGTDTERAVERFLQANGFPNAEKRRQRGRRDAGDMTGCPGICIEVKGGEAAKNASDAQIEAWLVETEVERRHAGADVGLLIVQRRGVGPANAGRWWAILRHVALCDMHTGNDRLVQPDTWNDIDRTPVRLHVADAVRLLRAAGYGDPLPAELPKETSP